ncbi:MAG: molybdate ABC transporter substrate-binding protein [Rudaea sp.]|nr:molybdate ABC transporter substrate-binding protein [Rudaea sp.]
MNDGRKRFGLACLAIAAAAVTASAQAEDLTVSAAASLADSFKAIAGKFEAAHGGSHVVLNFAASDILLRQIEQGAPADVFASADEATMNVADAAHRIVAESRHDFAGNVLVLIVPTNAPVPAKLATISDAAFRRIAIGNPDSVPAGRYAKQALQNAALWDTLQPKLVQAQNVRQALDYVARGEADAGFVYATDAATQAGKVRVALNLPTSPPVRYPIAALTDSAHAAMARDFVDFVLSADAQAVLRDFGFTAP